MVAEIVAIGTELLLGAVANTDAQFISKELAALGIFVHNHTVVGDNYERVQNAIRHAAKRADIIITTGGLGPTYDDMTKQAVADCFGLELSLDKTSLDRIYGYFERIGRPCTPNNEQQAWLPKGCTVLENSCGTAPGCAFENNGKHLIMLPGPPNECKSMLITGVVPYLEKLSGQSLVSRFIRFFGIGESALEMQLRQLMEQSINPTIAPYASDGEAYLRVTARGQNYDEAFMLTQPVVEQLCKQFSEYVYGVDVTSLEEAVSARLHEKHMTIAAAESCTGGLIAKRITDLNGASKIFWGGTVVYTSEAKVRLLGISDDKIREYGAVSEQIAISMSEAMLALSGADLAIGVTGLCGAEPDEKGTPGGTVFISLSKKDGNTKVKQVNVGVERSRARTLATGYAFKFILDEIGL